MTVKNVKTVIIVSFVFALFIQLFAWFMTALTAEGVGLREGLTVIPFDFTAFLIVWIVLIAFSFLSFKLQNIKIGFITKKRALVAVICLAAMFFAIRINNFNILGYRGLVPGNIETAHMISIGETRGVRSDEWQSIAEYFHNSFVGPLKLLWQNSKTPLKIADNILRMITPLHWGDLFMPIDFNLSWNFILMYVVGLYGFYRLFCLITGSRRFSVIASFIIVYSPQFQWWWGPKDFGMLTCFVVFFHDFFDADKVWKKLLYSYGLVSLAYLIIENAYPAWDVPMIYLLLFLLVAIYFTEKRINIKKSDIPYILVVAALFGVMILGYFYADPETKAAEMNTVYPGSRFVTGGNMEFSWLGNYLIMPFLPWKNITMLIPGVLESNICAHLTLFPLPYIIYIIKFKDFKGNRPMRSLVIFSILCLIYMFAGIGEKFATVTFLGFSSESRVGDIWGLALLILLLLECFNIKAFETGMLKEKSSILCLAATLAVMGVYICFNLLTRPDFNYYVGGAMMAYWVVLILIMSGLLSMGLKKTFILIMILLTMVSGFVVNPLNVGCSMMYRTPLAEEIRAIDNEDPGNWVALDDFVLSKYVYAQGVECLNYLNWPPRFDLYRPLDKNGENENVYNRYAHVNVELTDNETSFELTQGDKFTLHMNYDDLRIWDVKYLAIQRKTLTDSQNVSFERIFEDELDGINIYKVNYK